MSKYDLLGSSPWTRAPRLLLRRPAVFLAIVVATGVLAVAASSGVLFLSTLGTASLRAQAADDCPEASRPSFQALVDAGHVAAANAAGAAAMRAAGALGDPYWVDLTTSEIQASPITVFARPGALSHVRRLTPADGGPGAWFPDDFAAKLDVRPGDVVATKSGARIRVAGIYQALSPDPFHLAGLPRYWCTWSDSILQKATDPSTAPFLISDAATVGAVRAAHGEVITLPGGQVVDSSGQLVDTTVDVQWYDPIPVASISMSRAQDAARAAARAAKTYLAGSSVAHAPPAGSPTQLAITAPNTLPAKLTTARQVQTGLGGSVLPIDLAGVLVALLLTAGAGGFWAAHRAREIELLRTRGVGPALFGVKAVLETLPAAAVGLTAGLAASFALIRAVGPAPQFAPGAPIRAGLAAVVAVFAGLVLIGAIGVRAGRDRVMGAPAVRGRHLPWELTLVALAGWAWWRIRDAGGITVEHTTVVRVAPVVLLFPLLGATGVLLLAGRLTAFGIPPLARVRRIGRAGYLALRRIGGSRAIAIGLIVGTALPCSLLAYASTVREGVHTEIARKYQTNLGAPVVLQMIGVRFAAPRLDGHGTAVVLYPNGATLAGGQPVAVLGLDPATFAAFAFTTAGQRRDVDRLRTARTGDAARAIFVQAKSAGDPSAVHLGSTTLAVDVVAHSDVFPGLRSPIDPMVVVNRSVLSTIDPSLDRANEVWTSLSQVASVSSTVARAGYGVLGQLDPNIRLGNTGLLPLTWIFGYLRALAILIGSVVVAGLVFALGARTRRRTVSYVMSRRMGLRQLTHVTSLLIELGIVVGLGWLLGTAVGLAGYALLIGSLDLYPSLPPGAAFGLPGDALLVTAAVVLVVIVIAAIATHVASERANPADILRLE